MSAGSGVAPPPDGEDAILSLPLHRVVAEWPEALAVVRRLHVPLATEGGRSVGGLDTGGRIARAVLEATAWRADGGPAGR